MDNNLIKKQIKAVAKTYTYHDFCLPLTQKEEHELAQKILNKMSEHPHMDVRDIVHDFVYSFFAGLDDD